MIFEEMVTSLLRELEERRDQADATAWKIEKRIRWFWWLSLLLAGAASLCGFLALVPSLQGAVHIQPWFISLLTLGASGCQIVRQKSGWRAVSNEFYRHRDMVEQLRIRLLYENPTEQEVIGIAKAFREERRRSGEALRDINDIRDEHEHSAPKKA